MPGPDHATPAAVDLVIGLTSDNDARTIATVARAVQDGLARYFGAQTTRIVLADGRSSDGTREAARAVVSADRLVEVEYTVPAGLPELPYHGRPGRAAAVRAVLQAAHAMGAKACALIDADRTSVTPDWIEHLVGPVLVDGFDYVSPYYVRRAHEGAMTKGLVYPTVRALYGARLRQPAAAEFGCSARLVTVLLEQDFWDVEHAPEGIDLWLAVAAVCAELRVCEAAFGVRAPARDTPADLSVTLAQIAGAVFTDVENRVETWQRTRRSEAIPMFGVSAGLEPGGAVPTGPLLDAFRLGYRELREIWTWVLPPRTLVELRRLTEGPADRLAFDDRLWATIVYDFALGYAFRTLPHEHLLGSLTPLYSGWLASFLLQTQGASLADVEQRVEQLCGAFEAEKRYLIARWRWPERLR